MWDLVGNPEDPFSHNETQLNLLDCLLFLVKISVILLHNQDYQFSAIYEYNEQSKHASHDTGHPYGFTNIVMQWSTDIDIGITT